jgi:hypothetical protein
MIQFSQPVSPEFISRNNKVYLDLFDKFDTSLGEHSPLWTITSQFTKKSFTYIVSTVFTNKERYLEMNTVTSYGVVPSTNVIVLGTTDYPLGLYDVTIYQNTSSSNVDPTGLNVLYTGLMNLTTNDSKLPVQYSEYTTNDSDTESVYITF